MIEFKSTDYNAISRLTEEQIKEVFRALWLSKPHSRFLTHLAEAVVAAEGDDFRLIQPAALYAIAHYRLPYLVPRL